MYIARLQLKGFKSFGGAHDLPLSPGMTAIVGPNGSGKSNRLDAMRWVLGDSHASTLRISRQGDLLFQGSVSKARADEAEVSIQMRDGIRVCTIRRKVTEGGAQVTVDGARVTMSELDETKRTWQLGGDRFAFISQGDVSDVIQQRPNARRVLLESLFGIDIYRKRRDDASARLSDTKEEYDRLRTFSAELTARRSEIAPLVERAALAREILDSLEEERKLLYWVRRAGNENLIRENEELKQSLSGLLKMREVWSARWERSAAFAEGGISELSARRQMQVRELDEAKSSIMHFTRTAYGFGSSLTQASGRLHRAVEERAGLLVKLDELRRDKASSEQSSRDSRKELEAGKKILQRAEERYEQEQAAIKRDREKRERLNRERGELDGEISTLKGRMKSIGLALRELKEKSESSGYDSLIKEIRREQQELERDHGRLLELQEASAVSHRDIYARLQEVSAELQRKKRESQKLSLRLSELQDQAQSEIYPRPVQHLLSAARLGRLQLKLRAVIDAFTCPQELAAAMEAYLGGRQFWLLLETMSDAEKCIEQLKKGQLGRASFLPLERSRPRRRDDSYRLPTDGVTGWASDLMTFEDEWRPAMEHLIGDLIIVDTYRAAQGMVRGGFRGPIVTLDGDVFQPTGSISGGRTQKSGRALEIKSALRALEAESKAAQSAVDSLSAEFAALESRELQAAEKKNAVSAEIRELSARRSALDSRSDELVRERTFAKSERERIIKSLSDGAKQYAELASRRRGLDATLPPDTGEFDVKLVKEIERLKSSAALLEEKLRSGFVLLERVTAELRKAERDLEDLDEEISACELELAKNRANLTRLAARYAEVAARKRAVSAEMAEFAVRYEEISRRRDRRIARVARARSARDEAALQLNMTESQSASLERECNELIQTWEDQYPYPGSGAFDPADPEELKKLIREKDRTLKALGDVDMGVLSEDRNLRDRLAYLGEQLDDVSSAVMELERLITDADEQARVIFTNALEEIDKKFGDLFQRLFGGGDARLEMIEGDSLWESGVDVVARPPGKHPQSIAQLSGGEQSLSAVALLFASLEVAQSPIAVLDEVDAALDEVNLRRFAELAKEISRERQIFVMTHRRVTMERADVLYGVTLAEPGLSQVIGVRVEDWA